MAVLYYVYRIPTGRRSLEQELERKQLIGTLTFDNSKKTFTWEMNPGDFMFNLAFQAKTHGVVNDDGALMPVIDWVYRVFRQIDIVRYDRSEVTEEMRV